MKRLCCLFALAAGLALVTGLRAADDPPKKADDAAAKARGQLPAGWSKIGLTDEQKKKIQRIDADFGTQINELKTKIEKLQNDMRAERLKVLTDDQKNKLKELAVGEKPPEKKP